MSRDDDQPVYYGDYIPGSGWAEKTYAFCPSCGTTDHDVHKTGCYFVPDPVTVGDLVTPIDESADESQPPPSRPSTIKGGRLLTGIDPFAQARNQIRGHSWLDGLYRASLSAAEAKFSGPGTAETRVSVTRAIAWLPKDCGAFTTDGQYDESGHGTFRRVIEWRPWIGRLGTVRITDELTLTRADDPA